MNSNGNPIKGKEIADKVSGIIRQLGKCGIVANTPTTIYSWDSEAKPYASCLHSGLFMSGIYADLSDLTFNGKLDILVRAFTDSNNLVVDKKTKPEHIRRLRDTVDILKEDVVKGTYYIRLLKDECRTYREGVFPEFRGKKIYSTMK